MYVKSYIDVCHIFNLNTEGAAWDICAGINYGGRVNDKSINSLIQYLPDKNRVDATILIRSLIFNQEEITKQFEYYKTQMAIFQANKGFGLLN